MTSGPRTIAVGLVLHRTNLVQPLMSGLPTLDLEGGARASVRIFRNAFEPAGPLDRDVLWTLVSKIIALDEQLREACRGRVQRELPGEEPS